MITSERVAKRLGTILTLDHVLGTTFKNVKVFQFPSTGKSNPRPYLMPKKSFKRPRRSTLHLNICENNKTLLELGANRAHSLIRIFVTSLINRKVPVKIQKFIVTWFLRPKSIYVRGIEIFIGNCVNSTAHPVPWNTMIFPRFSYPSGF